MSRRNVDLAAVAAAAAVGALVAVLVPDLHAVRAVFSVPLLLVLPGYAVHAALFPTRGVDWWRVLVLSLGLSLSLGIAVGLVLDLAPGGLRSTSWAGSLLVITCASCAVAHRRRRGAESSSNSWLLPRLRSRDVAAFAVAGLALAGAVVLARTPLGATKAQGYSALWLLPAGPKPVAAVQVGVSSDELELTRYRLVVRVGAQVVDRRSIVLEPGSEWERSLSLHQLSPGDGAAIEAVLYRSDRPNSVYRMARIWPPTGSRQ